jgi:phage FluMu protein gp41
MTMTMPEAQSPHLLRTEVEFTLPLGYLDSAGTLHRQGVMRLATAADEIQPQQDPRVLANQAYIGVLLLSRVLLRLGSISPVPARMVEGLFSADYAYLQDLYVRLNEPGGTLADTRCPECGAQFTVDVSGVA